MSSATHGSLPGSASAQKTKNTKMSIYFILNHEDNESSMQTVASDAASASHMDTTMPESSPLDTLATLAMVANQEMNAGAVCSENASKKSPCNSADKRVGWSDEQDARLKEIVLKHGARRWDGLAKEYMPERTGTQMRSRWMYVIARKNESWKRFTEEEDKKVLELHARLGPKWSQIAKHLEGRLDQDVKNRFRTLKLKAKDAAKAAKKNTTPSFSSELSN
eukprot:CAMPEP_0184691912 /NCGR_PEP_ID=MMETSP0313-20130426/605_1 /TAXON_ID=2792 /ORGANISM="Porphyridium aerugineum, Strain SAG 1380-2" /LENGTH=220 /DNA_ID=CAMNT_0027149691 /DNA_START=68 /DNA_END=730 /DNA_ORIENTATION=+